MRLLHSADWQLGCPFRSFGDRAPRLRAQRLATLRRALELARREHVDAFLVAGDLFDDTQVAPAVVQETGQLFAEFPDVSIWLLPGNHDPACGPGSVWLRPPLDNPPSHVHVLTEAGAVPLAGGWLLASPLHQKRSPHDPSLALRELAAGVPPGSIKVGITHGALAIAGKHQPDDHPIALDAATRAHLDYLAVGHWHSWQVYDNDRLVMPGTPEPDAFSNAGGRSVALVEIDAPGAPPRIQRIDVAGLAWQELAIDLGLGEGALALATQALAQLQPQAASIVLRIILEGTAERAHVNAVRGAIEPRLQDFVAAELLDHSHWRLSGPEFAALCRMHPLLEQVAADLARLRVFASGTADETVPASTDITLAGFHELAQRLRVEPTFFDEAFFQAAADLLVIPTKEKPS